LIFSQILSFANLFSFIKVGQLSHQFLSVQPSTLSGYDVIQKSFQIITRGEYTKSLVTTKLLDTFVDRETAEIVARKLAGIHGFACVPHDTSIISLIPFSNRSFLIVEIQPNGEIIGRGPILDWVSSVRNARDVAKQCGLSFVFPKFS